MKPRFFKTAAAFRDWLSKNHNTAPEVLVGYYKAGSGKLNMTWSESVDQALCYGWIDGVRSSIDEDRYQIRFTPRREHSIWSAVNLKKVEALKKQGLMQPPGLAIYKKRKPANEKLYTHENEVLEFSAPLQNIFKANKPAWKFFQRLPASYQKLSKNWVMNAKQETTRLKRLQLLIKESEHGTNPWRDNKYKKK